ncbi:peptidoglycan DD-metalloendopeptidase family protein [Dasania sp. GY-MA-18]|uniref:Peptidoglycan DD-metalloendopeptidase family protein n=1 Tax=Dasania phycosphaerae TaxID=2950436 RepID=A0A9J6RSL5_9GAMM|nr:MULTISPECIES: peptidoglycan DD-metalloendopeptidase family protein [Dasania]MCR8924402.1 peptidoglycan DD-metalloendopeptidase family protein [Dasania sp. GY-MA-18]MCZ0867077.1 peptidoglycan DD-metalloendopeptidase family protein [Dasania phycosphaerae]MCZ0870529.1 peptidoglycan DD-metalloendopeptidase family protein [Dasania phycosphaerae]
MSQATPNKPSQHLSQLIAEFPRRHLLIAIAACCLLFITLMVMPSQEAEALRTSQSITLPIASKPIIEEPAVAATPQAPWKELVVQKGDNLSLLFQRAQLTGRDVYEITSSSKKAKQLTQIYPGQKVAFQIDADGKLLALKHQHDLLKSTLYQRAEDGFTVTDLEREPEIRQRHVTATISSSLYTAASKAGLQQNLIMEMANVFGGVIDFVYDIREGDSFSILFQEHFIDGKKVGSGPILAAEFINQDQSYKAYRYEYGNGDIGYYNEQGISMRKAFLRAPLDFTRISSSFNPNRLHPVFKTKRPHRGIDYAAPKGTPVYATGDGRVVEAGYNKANGNYVVIKHGESYTTKYLHFTKRAVKRGQKVKQQQIIGWVGSTGYATGPHLHYEFLVNGVHRNPRTVLRKLPKAVSIAAADKDEFLKQIGSLQMQLAAFQNHHKYAANTSATNNAL